MFLIWEGEIRIGFVCIQMGLGEECRLDFLYNGNIELVQMAILPGGSTAGSWRTWN